MNILKVKLSGQRIKYEVMKVSFKDNDLIKAKRWKWDNNGSLYYIGNRLDILRDYDTFDCIDAGVAIHPIGEINYEMGNTHGVITMDNVLNAINHKILVSYRRAKEEEGLTLLNADVYDNNIYEYTIEVGDGELFDASLLEMVSIICPITEEQHIVELRYNGKKMKGGIEGLSFRGEPVSNTSMLTVPQEYADALGLDENRRLKKILKFEDFIKEDNTKDGKKPINQVKSVKDFMQIGEDYIHSFINEHEPDHEPEEE